MADNCNKTLTVGVHKLETAFSFQCFSINLLILSYVFDYFVCKSCREPIKSFIYLRSMILFCDPWGIYMFLFVLSVISFCLIIDGWLING